MSTQTRAFPSGEMRASDADRDLAIAELSEHFQTGRLTKEEFDDRSARGLQARTGRELSELFTDLPGSADPSPSSGEPWQGPAWCGPASWPSRGPLGQSPSGRRPVPFVIVGVVAAIAVASLIGSAVHVGVGHVGIGSGGFGWLIPVFIILLVVRRIARHR
jgi:uncharacterized membrane protein